MGFNSLHPDQKFKEEKFCWGIVQLGRTPVFEIGNVRFKPYFPSQFPGRLTGRTLLSGSGNKGSRPFLGTRFMEVKCK